MNFKDRINTLLEENRRLLEDVRAESVEELLTLIRNANALFCSAQGRSGFVLRCFCMRLMHLGFQTFFSGETITPSINPGDLLIVLSGSGETPSTVEAVKISKQRHVKTYGILGNLDSRVADLVDYRIHINGTTKLCSEGEPLSVQMSGSLFEQSAFIFLEAVILELFLNRAEEIGKVSKHHAIIE